MKKVKRKLCSFIQDWGTYGNQTYVVAGMTHAEIIKDMRKRHFPQYVIDVYNKDLGQGTRYEDANAFVYSFEGRTVLWFSSWKNDDSHLNTLVHETNHLIYDIIYKYKDMKDEPEAMAYQQEYLFSSIKGELNKRLDKKIKK